MPRCILYLAHESGGAAVLAAVAGATDHAGAVETGAVGRGGRGIAVMSLAASTLVEQSALVWQAGGAQWFSCLHGLVGRALAHVAARAEHVAAHLCR